MTLTLTMTLIDNDNYNNNNNNNNNNLSKLAKKYQLTKLFFICKTTLKNYNSKQGT